MSFPFSKQNMDTNALFLYLTSKKCLLAPTMEHKHCIIYQKEHEDEWSTASTSKHLEPSDGD